MQALTVSENIDKATWVSAKFWKFENLEINFFIEKIEIDAWIQTGDLLVAEPIRRPPDQGNLFALIKSFIFKEIIDLGGYCWPGLIYELSPTLLLDSQT